MGSAQDDRNTFGVRFDRAQGASTEAEAAGAPAVAEPVAPARTPVVPWQGADSIGGGGWLGEGFVIGVLYVLAGLVGALGVVAGLYWLWVAALRRVHVGDWVIVAGCIVGGLALAGVLVAASAVLSAVGRQRRQVRDLTGELTDLAGRVERLGQLVPDGQVLDQLRDRLDRLGESVADVARDSLLDETGRAARRGEMDRQRRDQAVEQVRREMSDGHWDRAAEAIERLGAGYPAEADRAAQLSDELVRRRRQAEAADVAAAARQCGELMSVSAWDRAQSAAAELIARHPESASAKALLARIGRERRVAEEQHRQALYAQIQRHTSRREWNLALQAAQRLIDRFPGSVETESVKGQLETLQANAEIQHRQAIEATIKDMIRRQRFDEAARLAEDLINVYPNSPQATVLRDQLGRLKERADESAREARKRRVQWQ